MVRLKSSSVDIRPLHPAFSFILLPALQHHWSKLGLDVIMITSAAEFSVRHSATSLHYAGRAIDVRSKPGLPHGIPHELRVREALARSLSESLGPDWDVILEDPDGEHEHFHIEFQPKRRVEG